MDDPLLCRCGLRFRNVKAKAGHISTHPGCRLSLEERRVRARAMEQARRHRNGVRPMLGYAARFWSKVDASGGMDACWPWQGVRTPNGYGQLWDRGRQRQATHAALALAGRPVGPGQFACHSCDNPPCVNPAHLFVGSPLDNMLDAIAKGRMVPGNPWRGHTRGEDHPRAKLSDASVRDIRALAGVIPQREMARRYGVSKSTIKDVVAMRSWTHVEGRAS